jgi:hypothetical protein
MSDGWEVARGLNPLVNGASDVRVRLRAGSRPGASGFVIQVQGDLGQRIDLQRSMDLKTWEDWTTTTGTGVFQEVIDVEAGAAPARFYRARAL